MKRKLLAGFGAAALLAAATTGVAAAAPPGTTHGFVCPVLGGQAGVNGSADVFASPAGTYNTVIGPDVTVPVLATNNNGDSTPLSNCLSPGDSDYSAIRLDCE